MSKHHLLVSTLLGAVLCAPGAALAHCAQSADRWPRQQMKP
jgi:hypothetical protein